MSKVAAIGSSLVYDPAGTPVTIAQVKDITGPGLSTDAIDVTSHDSTSAHREFLAGLVNPGEVTVELEFDMQQSGYSGTTALGLMEAKASSRAIDTWQVQGPTGSGEYRRFSAFVKSFEPALPVDGSISARATMQVTGVITKGESA